MPRLITPGILTVAGKFPFTEETRGLLPERLATGPNYVLPPRGCGMFTAPHVFGGAAVNDESAELDPVLFDNTGSYVMWAYGASKPRFPATLSEMDGVGLKAVVLDQIRTWHPGFPRRRSNRSSTISSGAC